MHQRLMSKVSAFAAALCGLSLVPATGADAGSDNDPELAYVQVNATRIGEKGFASPMQPAPNNQGLRVRALELTGHDPGERRNVGVQVEITTWNDDRPIPAKNIQDLEILDTDGRPMGFRNRNPDELPLDLRWNVNSRYVATYELADPSKLQSLGKVTFQYLGKAFTFDMTPRMQ